MIANFEFNSSRENINYVTYNVSNQKKGFMKNLPKQNLGLLVGRSLANARKFKRSNPKVVTKKEWECLKTLTKLWHYKKVASATGRGVNTILRVKKSNDFAEYQRSNQVDSGSMPLVTIEKRETNWVNSKPSLPENQYNRAEYEAKQEARMLNARMDSAEARERIQIYFLAGIFLILALITWLLTQ